MNKSLVAYFSASGVTAKVAERLSESAGTDLFEIVPVEPYTEKDIKWTNPVARCNREKIGKKDVPIRGKIDNMGDYSVVFVGFPIWYYSAPNIIVTFLNSYDFTGKKVVLFATSGGSDIAKTPDRIKSLIPASVHIAGAKLFSPDAPADELGAWAKQFV